MKKYDGILMDMKNRNNWIGIIGSRNASKEELKMAYMLAKKSVEMNKVVVSGLAAGIDYAGHKGAMDAGGKTIAIVNTPPFQGIYPQENRPLAERIKENGGILYPFQTKAEEQEEKKGLNRFSKRLIERDILLAYMCPVIVVISDDEVITGGSRWATAYGKEMNKVVKRINSKGEIFDNPPTEKTNLYWEMELKLN